MIQLYNIFSLILKCFSLLGLALFTWACLGAGYSNNVNESLNSQWLLRPTKYKLFLMAPFLGQWNRSGLGSKLPSFSVETARQWEKWANEIPVLLQEALQVNFPTCGLPFVIWEMVIRFLSWDLKPLFSPFCTSWLKMKYLIIVCAIEIQSSGLGNPPVYCKVSNFILPGLLDMIQWTQQLFCL